jgi:hypothetical protein
VLALTPAVVEELLAIRVAWLAAYTGPDASAVRAGLGDCSIAAHRPGGHADQIRPTVPAKAALDQLADWWTTSHGTTGAPAPIAYLEVATADQQRLRGSG